MSVEKIPITSRAQWLDLRRKFITASDVAAICHEDAYGRSPLAVYAEKTGLIPPPEENDAMRRGRWCEAAVFEALAEEYPTWEFRRAKVFLADHEARLGATPDGVFFDPEQPKQIGLVQCKVVSRPIFQRDWLDDPDNKREDREAPAHVPMGYQLQTITEGMLADADRLIVAALVLDTFTAFLRVIPVERHAAAEESIRRNVKKFWDDAAQGIMPTVDPSRDAPIVKALYPRDDGTEIDLSGDNELPDLVDRRAAAKVDMKGSEAEIERVETAIKAKLGVHTYGRMNDGRLISWKEQHRAAYSVGPKSFRMLRVKDAPR